MSSSVEHKGMADKILALLSPDKKKKLLLLLLFTILVSIMETVGISAIMPFISVASNFSLIESNEWFSKAYNLLQFTSAKNFVMAFGLILIGFYLLRGTINLIYMYSINLFAHGLAYSLSIKLFSNYIHLNYRDFIKQNTSDFSKKLITEMQYIANFFTALMMLFSEIIIVTFIYCVLLLINFKVTLVLTLFLFLKTLLFLKTITRRMTKEGDRRNESHKSYYKIISESLKNLKIIRLSSSEPIVEGDFANAGYGYMRSTVVSASISQIPRLSLESVGFSILISIVLYVLWSNGEPSKVIPTITMFAIAMYRLLPSINRIMSSYNKLQYLKSSLNLIYSDLKLPTETYGEQKLNFSSSIEIKNLSFAYDTKKVLKNINLTIHKGERIAFVGPSGSGKSTLADILIGMYSSFEGDILVDGNRVCAENLKSWRKMVGYIPQSMFLFDSTAGENVAFGRSYDEKKIERALEQADMKSFLEAKAGSDTAVGESGVMLSGGQKQRIAIARALYGNPSLLVLDEATSALDNATEKRIMQRIYDLDDDKTLVVIAHRLSTVKSCDRIFMVDNGTITPVTDLEQYERETESTTAGQA